MCNWRVLLAGRGVASWLLGCAAGLQPRPQAVAGTPCQSEGVEVVGIFGWGGRGERSGGGAWSAGVSVAPARRKGGGPLLGAAVVLASLVGPLPAAQAETSTFAYTGGAQEWMVPAGVTHATFDIYAAQGGDGHGGELGGRGGRATVTIAVTPGETLQINVGGMGGDGPGGAGGFNGGGGAGAAEGGADGGGGGGASDVRRGGSALSDRILVAGGGGGGGVLGGGAGGGTTGTAGLGFAGEGGSERAPRRPTAVTVALEGVSLRPALRARWVSAAAADPVLAGRAAVVVAVIRRRRWRWWWRRRRRDRRRRRRRQRLRPRRRRVCDRRTRWGRAGHDCLERRQRWRQRQQRGRQLPERQQPRPAQHRRRPSR